MNIVVPILIGVAYCFVVSFVPEPARRRFNAIFVAGAGAAYLSSGALGPWELVFTTAVTFCAYKGLTSYRWIGVAWLLHTVWDIVHHLLGKPILPFAPHSSFGCAVCDPVIALWCFAGGPSLRDLRGRIRPADGPAGSTATPEAADAPRNAPRA